MASTVDKTTADRRDVVASIDADELQAAQKDARVKALHDEADAYLAEFERQERNR